MARVRKNIEYDRSWPDGIVLGKSNTTQLLLGYATQVGDMAFALIPDDQRHRLHLRALPLSTRPNPQPLGSMPHQGPLPLGPGTPPPVAPRPGTPTPGGTRPARRRSASGSAIPLR